MAKNNGCWSRCFSSLFPRMRTRDMSRAFVNAEGVRVAGYHTPELIPSSAEGSAGALVNSEAADRDGYILAAGGFRPAPYQYGDGSVPEQVLGAANP